MPLLQVLKRFAFALCDVTLFTTGGVLLGVVAQLDWVSIVGAQ